jgi:hypothetical protein
MFLVLALVMIALILALIGWRFNRYGLRDRPAELPASRPG